MIRHVDGKWVLFTKDGTKRLGTHDMKEQAEAQERAVEASKHRAAEQVETYRALLDTRTLAYEGEHPFTYCMETVVPAMERDGKAPDNPEAFCAWWKMEHAEMKALAHVREYHLKTAAAGRVRRAIHDGREHVVVPVVALVEGVIHAINADTPELVPEATLRRAAASWNGRPIMLGHPTKDGHQISANDPAVLASHGIGTVFNARVEGKKLLCEAWLDPRKIKALGADDMLNRLLAGQVEEVSVGAFVLTDAASGEHNGKRYKAIWRETTGDHLAFLPKGKGACSIAMGCGACRAAAQHDSVHWALTTAWWKSAGPQLRAAEQAGGTPAEGVVQMDRKERIAKLVTCQHNPIKSAEVLEKMDDPSFEALEAHCGEQTEKFTAAEKRATDAEASLRTSQAKVSETETKLRAAEAEVRQARKQPTEEEWVKAAPPSIKTLIERQQKLDADKREALVTELKTAQEEYTEEELKAMEMSSLERLSRALKIETDKRVDFSGREMPRPRAATASDVFTSPPDPYAEGLKRLREKAAN